MAPASGISRSRTLTVVQLSVGDVNEARDRTAQIEQRVHLHGGLGSAERRPRENRQTQIDCRRIERIGRFAEFHPEALYRIELSGLTDQHLGEVGVNAPVAGFVRVGQRRAPNRFAEPHVIKLRDLGRQAGFDVSETFSRGQLGKRHNPEMFGTAQRLDVTVAAIPLDNPRKCCPRQKIHQLGEQRLARIHWPLRECLPGKVEQEAPPHSNRHRPCSLRKPAPAAGFRSCTVCFPGH